jgi:hypothetical protein
MARKPVDLKREKAVRAYGGSKVNAIIAQKDKDTYAVAQKSRNRYEPIWKCPFCQRGILAAGTYRIFVRASCWVCHATVHVGMI